MTYEELLLQRGREEGIEKGIEKGREEGKLETLYKTARNFLKLGISAEQIAQATSLPLQEILNLEEQTAA